MAVPLYLIQTDTTVGLASKDSTRLNRIKGRPEGKPFLRTLGSLKALRGECRVQKRMRKRIRRSKKSTYVFGDGIARRVVAQGEYGAFLRRFGWHYSTSANQSGGKFDFKWAEGVCDILVFRPEPFIETASSSLYQIGKKRLKKLR